MAAPAWTLPTCPNCDGKQTAVLHPDTETWFCFQCRSHGSFTVELKTEGTYAPHGQPDPQPEADTTP